MEKFQSNPEFPLEGLSFLTRPKETEDIHSKRWQGAPGLSADTRAEQVPPYPGVPCELCSEQFRLDWASLADGLPRSLSSAFLLSRHNSLDGMQQSGILLILTSIAGPSLGLLQKRVHHCGSSPLAGLGRLA